MAWEESIFRISLPPQCQSSGGTKEFTRPAVGSLFPMPSEGDVSGMPEFDSRDLPVAADQRFAFLEEIFRSAEIGICVTDEERRFVLINGAYCRTYGYPREELIGEEFVKVLPTQHRDMAARLHDEFLEGDDEVAGEWQVQHRDGSIRSVMVTAGRVVLADGRRFKVTTVQDISELRDQQAHLRQLSEAVERSVDGVIYTDAEGLTIWVNQGMERLTGYSNEEMRGRKPGELLQTDKTDRETIGHMSRQLAAGQGFQVDVLNRTREGRDYWVHIVCSPISDRFGHLQGFIAFQIDLSEQMRFRERIHELSFQDALTALPNRRSFEDRLKRRLAERAHDENWGALLLCDLNHFKLVNEALGPREADNLLVWIARILQRLLYRSDIIARLGGDEFGIVLADLSSDPGEAAARTEQIAETILSALAQPLEDLMLPQRVSASIGAVLFDGRCQDVDELKQKGDIALYQAKRSGKSKFAFFDPEMQATLVRRYRTEVELREAIRMGQLVPYYQRQVNEHGELVGVELLARWQHPERGILLPKDFIEVAEASSLILELGFEVVRMALTQLERWSQDARTCRLPIAVNLSARHFEEPDFEATVSAMLAEKPGLSSLLKFEITESAVLVDLDHIAGHMEALRQLGVHFSLDDFGTGNASLMYLKRLPLSEVKIDRGFIQDMASERKDRGIIESIVLLARNLDMQVVAEGVETKSQRDQLLQLGCEVYQGFLFGRPVPVDEAVPL
jgi:diguanylate cyclase (GGDEF)-like protein/PAS domain S-box-containing protein